MNNNLDDEKTNRQFTILCYLILIAFAIGVISGLLGAFFIYKYCIAN